MINMHQIVYLFVPDISLCVSGPEIIMFAHKN